MRMMSPPRTDSGPPDAATGDPNVKQPGGTDVMTKPTRLSAGILLWDGVEMLDWVGPYEVLATATPLEVTQPGALKYYFDPITLARKPIVRCMGDVRVTVDRTLDRAGKLDILIIPGGPAVLPRDPIRI